MHHIDADNYLQVDRWLPEGSTVTVFVTVMQGQLIGRPGLSTSYVLGVVDGVSQALKMTNPPPSQQDGYRPPTETTNKSTPSGFTDFPQAGTNDIVEDYLIGLAVLPGPAQ